MGRGKAGKGREMGREKMLIPLPLHCSLPSVLLLLSSSSSLSLSLSLSLSFFLQALDDIKVAMAAIDKEDASVHPVIWGGIWRLFLEFFFSFFFFSFSPSFFPSPTILSFLSRFSPLTCPRMPAQFVRRDPCQRSMRFPMASLKGVSRDTRYRASSSRL